MATVTVKEAFSPLQKKIRSRLAWLMSLNVLALLLTGYLTYLHYKPSASTLCKINEYLDCDIVNKSVYSEFFGIPVAIFGFLTYLFLFLVARALRKGFRFTRWHAFFTNHRVLWILFGVVAVGTLFSLYLTYIELFVLQAVCIFCFGQQLIILIELFLLLSILSAIDNGKRENPDVCEFC